MAALWQAVETKDLYTRGHSERVSRGAVMIGREIGMRANRVEAILYAGMLHDVGKLGVPATVLRKGGPLTEEEFAAIQLPHARPGYRPGDQVPGRGPGWDHARESPQTSRTTAVVYSSCPGGVIAQFVTAPGPGAKRTALTGSTGTYRNIGGDRTLVEFGNGRGEAGPSTS